MSKHRITIELSAEAEKAISNTKERKPRNLEIGEFLLSACEAAIPAKVAKYRMERAAALQAEAEALRATVSQQ